MCQKSISVNTLNQWGNWGTDRSQATQHVGGQAQPTRLRPLSVLLFRRGFGFTLMHRYQVHFRILAFHFYLIIYFCKLQSLKATQAISSNTIFKVCRYWCLKRMKRYFILSNLMKVFSYISIYCFILRCFYNTQLLCQSIEKYSY